MNTETTFMTRDEYRDTLPYIRTYTGKKWIYEWPLAEDVEILDIAHSLSQICRFTGHTRSFYCVSQHSCLVSDLCENRLWGLLHDASECYVTDLARSLKYSPGLEGYKKYEKMTMDVICEHFGLDKQEPAEVKLADQRALATEGRDLFDCEETWGDKEPLDYQIVPWTSEIAETEFLKRFYEIRGNSE